MGMTVGHPQCFPAHPSLYFIPCNPTTHVHPVTGCYAAAEVIAEPRNAKASPLKTPHCLPSVQDLLAGTAGLTVPARALNFEVDRTEAESASSPRVCRDESLVGFPPSFFIPAEKK